MLDKETFIQKAGSPLFTDRYYKKAASLLQEWNGIEEIKGTAVIGVPLSKPSISHSGACFTPATVRKLFHNYSTYAVETREDLQSSKLTDCGDVLMHATDIKESYRRIEQSIEKLIRENPSLHPIFIGGDHSITYSLVKGMSNAKAGTIGVIQFDAHHDLRNTEDGGPTNGTPFNRLLSDEVLQGAHLVQVGIRNYSNSEYYHQFALEKGIRISTMKDVQEKGILCVIEESLEYLQGKVDHIYISVDMDVLDQAYAPGCPALGPGGMTSRELLEAVYKVAQHDKVCGIDIVEIDPTIDFRDMTSRVAVHVMLEYLRGIDIS
ncbi:formimidoylglutamase [Sutcliffiella cohnii]|uniref:formimidoylglutamase n=1 Tax=Sutcliffiella TaxID=2837511 RepID=UPI000B25C590